MVMQMDRLLQDSEEVDAVILPGGLPGAENLAASDRLASVLRAQFGSGRLVAAICASPGLVLARHGLLCGKRATCYPGFESNFPQDAAYLTEDVVVDGNVITSRGPGTAFPFALALARELAGPEVAERLAEGTLHVR
jgi:4-methyl-5(b-hydroxyethyl)-thiazole monophosphate biosynthesis